jgi:hypothetical protein
MPPAVKVTVGLVLAVVVGAAEQHGYRPTTTTKTLKMMMVSLTSKLGYNKAQVGDRLHFLGFRFGAGDENRTRTVSLGIFDHFEHLSGLDAVTSG